MLISGDSSNFFPVDKASSSGASNPFGSGKEFHSKDKVDKDEGRKSRKAEELTPKEKQQIAKLKQRDTEVRAHEQAHKSAGSGITGGVSYSYQTGPDGKRYAVGGEVSIDVSSEKDPQATISKMRRVKQAAMAPADPSGQDQAVARQANAKMAQAEKELAQDKCEKEEKTTSVGGQNLQSKFAEEKPKGSLINTVV